MVRNSLKYVSWKDYKAVTADLKLIYKSATESDARLELQAFAEKWDHKYPQISKSWYRDWENLITLFDCPAEIRKVIYTTNAIWSSNSVIRKVSKKRKIFPNDKSVSKVIYLACMDVSKKWTKSVRDWNAALNYFVIVFEDCLVDYI